LAQGVPIGGGQQKYETLQKAVIRECMEETGYEVKPIKLVGVCEKICLDTEFRELYSDYAHKMYHILTCELLNDKPNTPTEKDSMQRNSELIAVESLANVRLLPKVIGEQIVDLLKWCCPIFTWFRAH